MCYFILIIEFEIEYRFFDHNLNVEEDSKTYDKHFHYNSVFIYNPYIILNKCLLKNVCFVNFLKLFLS
jgi:hypothetical protein